MYRYPETDGHSSYKRSRSMAAIRSLLPQLALGPESMTYPRRTVASSSNTQIPQRSSRPVILRYSSPRAIWRKRQWGCPSQQLSLICRGQLSLSLRLDLRRMAESLSETLKATNPTRSASCQETVRANRQSSSPSQTTMADIDGRMMGNRWPSLKSRERATQY